jgi:hypothetical protein
MMRCFSGKGCMAAFVSSGLAFSLLMTGLPVFAEQTLKSAKQPIQLEVRTAVNDKASHSGDIFEGVLKDDYHYQDHVLPAGTVLQGTVQEVRPSKTFNRAGFATLAIQQAVFPSGQVHTFNAPASDANAVPAHGLETKRIYHPDATPFKQNLVRNVIPFTLVSVATSVPLRYGADMSAGIILPITLGARVLLGLVLEHTKTEKTFHDRHNNSWPYRYGHGALRGTGVVGAYTFLRPAPNLDLQPGSVTPIYFKKKEFNNLFQANAGDASSSKTAMPLD